MDLHSDQVRAIEEMLSQGASYSEAIEQEQTYNKYINFKVIPMSKTTINKENFVWRTKGKETPLAEMDADFLLAALTHATKHISENYIKHEEAKKKARKHEKNMEHFSRLFEIMEDEFINRYGLEVPDDAEGIRAMRTLIKRGTLKIEALENE